MGTAANIISESFEIAGIASPTAAQNASAFKSLNYLLSTLHLEHLVYAVVSESFTLTEEDPEYTIGSGGDFDTARPMKIENCFIRDSENDDFQIAIMSANEYSRIHQKDNVARPERLYFLPEYPLAKIIFNCHPDAEYSAYFEFLKPATQFAASSDTLLMPVEYEDFLIYANAIRIAEKWDRQLAKTVYEHLEDTKFTIERLVASYKGVPEARFDIGRSDNLFHRTGDASLIDGGVF